MGNDRLRGHAGGEQYPAVGTGKTDRMKMGNTLQRHRQGKSFGVPLPALSLDDDTQPGVNEAS